MRPYSTIIVVFACFACGLANIVVAAPPATLEVLAPAPGARSTLTAGNDRNFYGTSYDGGAFGGGTIFRMTPDGQITILKSFEQSTTAIRAVDGSHPAWRLVRGPDGRLYGSCSAGGNFAQAVTPNGDGTVFAITEGGQFTKIADVPRTLDYFYPYPAVFIIAPLTFGQDGQIYGSRGDSVFRVSLNGDFATIKTFPPGSGHDARSQDPIIVGSRDGYFYGTFSSPSQFSFHYAFRMDATGTSNSVQLESFPATGGLEWAPLFEALDGNFYGFGPNRTIFKLTRNMTVSTLHTFTGPDGERPMDAMVQGSDGSFYGTTATGGANDPDPSFFSDIGGTAFRITPDGALTTLVSFDPSTGSMPRSALVQGPDGCFYGTTSTKGQNGTGTIFRLTAFPPKLVAAVPRSDLNGMRLVLHGQFFSGATSVTLNGAPASYFSVDSPTQITAIISSGQANGTITVTTLLGSTSLNIGMPPPGAVRNLSSRLPVSTGDNALFAGFVLTGSPDKKMLLRAMGPSLTKAGVTNALQDPIMELHNQQGALIATNDNWRSTQIGGVITADQAMDIQNSGLAPADDREAAMVVTLSPGAYTAIQRGTDNSSGVGVVELYDLSGSSPNAKLANISTRGFVRDNDNVLIGGFIVAQPDSTRVIVRAIGPSLTSLGVTNPLADPNIDLRDSNGTQIAFNNDWRQTQEQEIIQTTIPPKDDREAAIVATLAPGSYTAIVRGAENQTGTGVVEVYNLSP